MNVKSLIYPDTMESTPCALNMRYVSSSLLGCMASYFVHHVLDHYLEYDMLKDSYESWISRHIKTLLRY